MIKELPESANGITRSSKLLLLISNSLFKGTYAVAMVMPMEATMGIPMEAMMGMPIEPAMEGLIT